MQANQLRQHTDHQTLPVKQPTQVNQLKQQPQANQQAFLQVNANNNQHSAPLKIQSINVPLHKSKLDNQSMTRRSASIVARRLSLPYDKLPKLIPKPSIVKKLDQAQISGPNSVKIVQRTNNSNRGISSPLTNTLITAKTAQRPVPALNKVNMVNVNNSSGKKIAVTNVLRKSMPPPLAFSKSANTTAQTPVNAVSRRLIPVRAIQVKNLPPHVKPVPRTQSNSALKTYARDSKILQVDPNMPIISRVQNGEQLFKLNLGSTSEPSHAIESVQSVDMSSPVAMETRVPDVV